MHTVGGELSFKLTGGHFLSTVSAVRAGWVAALAVLALASCTNAPGAQSQPKMALLERPAGSQDTVPAFVDMAGKDPSTVRFAGESGDFRFYLARPEKEQGFCLIQVAAGDGNRWGSACRTTGEPILTANLLGYGSEAAVVADGANVDDLLAQGYTPVQDNILVRR